jgi:hypothetical protein
MMRKSLAIAAVIAGIAAAGHPANAQDYKVNGHTASRAEAQFLDSHGAQPGDWVIDGYGISYVQTRHDGGTPASKTAHKCWYVLDVKLCE